MVLTPAPTCTDRYRAGSNDGVTVNYKGTLAADGTTFEDTFMIGRPLEFTLGTGGVIKGWEKGIPGMCVGETRRLFIPPAFAYGEAGQPGKIPPNAHLTFDVELLAINGRDLTALRAEDAAAAASAAMAGAEKAAGNSWLHDLANSALAGADDDVGREAVEPAATDIADGDSAAAATAAAASTDEDILAVRLGQRESPYCDACSTVLEEFYGAWVTTMMRQVGTAEARSGGSAPPAVTYNDDTEAGMGGGYLFLLYKAGCVFETSPTCAQVERELQKRTQRLRVILLIYTAPRGRRALDRRRWCRGSAPTARWRRSARRPRCTRPTCGWPATAS